MTGQDVGQRVGWSWGCYSLGECADAVWRVADLLGSAIEPVAVNVVPPLSGEVLTTVELLVREPAVAWRLVELLPAEVESVTHNPQANPNVWSALVSDTFLVVRVVREP